MCQSGVSEAGYGVTVAEWLVGEVGRVWRQAERGRFKCCSKRRAREMALSGARLKSGSGQWCVERDTGADRTIDSHFTEVPPAQVVSSD